MKLSHVHFGSLNSFLFLKSIEFQKSDFVWRYTTAVQFDIHFFLIKLSNIYLCEIADFV